MNEKLNPTEAQRKAMALALARRVGRESFAQGDLDVVYHQIEAANSIPEGAPVGTIARRPDGKYLATRILTVSNGTPAWDYKNLTWPQEPWEYLHQSDADSWPVIYDPREDEGKERLRKLMTEPSIFEDPDRPGWTVC